jgi:hypothetical protein
MTVRRAGKSDAIFRMRNVHWGRDVVCKATVLVKVDNKQSVSRIRAGVYGYMGVKD